MVERAHVGRTPIRVSRNRNTRWIPIRRPLWTNILNSHKMHAQAQVRGEKPRRPLRIKAFELLHLDVNKGQHLKPLLSKSLNAHPRCSHLGRLQTILQRRHKEPQSADLGQRGQEEPKVLTSIEEGKKSLKS